MIKGVYHHLHPLKFFVVVAAKDIRIKCAFSLCVVYDVPMCMLVCLSVCVQVPWHACGGRGQFQVLVLIFHLVPDRIS